MHPLLRYTLDLFEPNAPPAPVNAQPIAIQSVANSLFQAGSRLDEVTQPARFAHPQANREARLGEALVGYQLKRGKRRTIGFSVGPDGLVVCFCGPRGLLDHVRRAMATHHVPERQLRYEFFEFR